MRYIHTTLSNRSLPSYFHQANGTVTAPACMERKATYMEGDGGLFFLFIFILFLDKGGVTFRRSGFCQNLYQVQEEEIPRAEKIICLPNRQRYGQPKQATTSESQRGCGTISSNLKEPLRFYVSLSNRRDKGKPCWVEERM